MTTTLRPLRSGFGVRAARRVLLLAGQHARPETLERLQAAFSYLELGSYAAQLPARPVHLATDFDVFSLALRRVRGTRPLYLEFGVYKGRTMRWWTSALANPEARFVGFDSFEGLPENWHQRYGKGTFNTAGAPDPWDGRLSFVAGWFEDTVPGWPFPEHDQLIVNVDCDLYSGAATALRAAEPHCRPGTLLYFDELPDRDNEQRALREFVHRSNIRLVPLATGGGGRHWLFTVTG